MNMDNPIAARRARIEREAEFLERCARLAVARRPADMVPPFCNPEGVADRWRHVCEAMAFALPPVGDRP